MRPNPIKNGTTWRERIGMGVKNYWWLHEFDLIDKFKQAKLSKLGVVCLNPWGRVSIHLGSFGMFLSTCGAPHVRGAIKTL